MRLLCDMGVSMKVVQWLRDQGHDCVHLRDEGLQRLPDGQVFAKAIAEDRVVVTFDLDFGDIVATMGSRVASVLLLRLRNARADRVIERLAAALDVAGGALESGAVVVVQESRFRIRHLPIGGAE